MKCLYSALIPVFFCLAAPGWSEATMKTASNPKNGPIFNICPTPADTRMTRVGMKGGENLSKESAEWAQKLDAAVKHAIERAGAKGAGDLSTNRLQRDEEMRQVVVRLRQKYENIAVQLLKKPGGVEKGRYTLGDEVALLPCAGQADAIAFVDGQGVSYTGGKKAFSVLVGGVPGMFMAQVRFDIWISLADARSGLVIGFVHGIASEARAGTDPEGSLSEPLAAALQKIHVGWVRPPTK